MERNAGGVREIGPVTTPQVEVDHAAYNDKYRQAMEREHFGRVALMHQGEVVGVYNDMGDAYSIGCEKYGLGNFSMKRIGQPPARLGSLGIAL